MKKIFLTAVFLYTFASIGICQDNVPMGTIMAYTLKPGDNPKEILLKGWRVCDGNAIQKRDCDPVLFPQLVTIYGASGTDAAFLPDLRGLFLRGVNSPADDKPKNEFVAGSDENRVAPLHSTTPGANNDVGSIQLDAVGMHQHNVHTRNPDNPIDYQNYTTSGSRTQSLGALDLLTDKRPGTGTGMSVETRAKNAYMYWIIKVIDPTLKSSKEWLKAAKAKYGK